MVTYMNSTTATPTTTTTHGPFPFVVGDLVKLSDWSDDEALQITAVGDIWFLASYRGVGERAYRISPEWIKVESTPLPDRWCYVLENGHTVNVIAESATQEAAAVVRIHGKRVVEIIHFGTDENGEDFAHVERVTS